MFLVHIFHYFTVFMAYNDLLESFLASSTLCSENACHVVQIFIDNIS